MSNDKITHLNWNGFYYVEKGGDFTDTYDNIPFNQDKINGSIVGLIKHIVPGVFVGSDIVAQNSVYRISILNMDAFQKDNQGQPNWKHMPLDINLIQRWLDKMQPFNNKYKYSAIQIDALLRINSLLNYYKAPIQQTQNVYIPHNNTSQTPILGHMNDIRALQINYNDRGGGQKKSRKSRRKHRRKRKHSSKRR